MPNEGAPIANGDAADTDDTGGQTTSGDTHTPLSDEDAQGTSVAHDQENPLLTAHAFSLEIPITPFAVAYQVNSASELQSAMDDALGPASLGDAIEIMQSFAIEAPIVVNAQAPTLSQLTIMSGTEATLTALSDRHFSVFTDDSFALVFSNIVFEGAASGGGVAVSRDLGTLTLDGSSTSVIHNCRAPQGGAFEIEGAATTIKGFSITDCVATLQGGGIAVARDTPPFALLDSSISGCDAPDGGGLWIGEGVNPVANMLGNVSFTDNHAASNGGAVVSGNALDVTGSTFTGNGADGSGGAIYLGASTESASVYLNVNTYLETSALCVFESNTAQGNGGAIGAVLSGGSLQLTFVLFDVHIKNNTAQGSSSGVSLQAPGGYGQIQMDDIEIRGNKAVAGSGGGVFVDADSGCTFSMYPMQETEIRSQVSGNTAGASGGGVSMKSGS